MNNKILSDFTGKDFNNSWDQLMSIVDNIESMDLVEEFKIVYDNTYKTQTVWIVPALKNTFNTIIIERDYLSKYEAIYTACLNFVDWYNNKQS